MTPPLRPLSPLEIASGLIVRPPRRTPRLPGLPHGTTPRETFEAAILPALQRAPCVVSFSGGRDSSAVLAAAAHVARREGLPLPIPATHRFPRADDTRESEWQEQVVRHLGLEDWHRIDVDDEFDCVGPVAVASLRRHGPLFPCNAYFHLPIFEAAAGGSVLTGVGGDEAFSPSSWARALTVLRLGARPRRRDLLDIPFALAPVAVKRRLIERWVPEVCPWLRPDAQRAVQDTIAAGAAEEPLRWRTRFARLLGSDYMEAALSSLAALGADCDVEVSHPLNDARFLSALASLPRRERFHSRSEAMAMLVGDLLEPEVLSRSTKARFDGVLWTRHSRALVAQWDGEGVDPELVDIDRLREEWASPTPDSHTCTLLQSLVARPRGVSRWGAPRAAWRSRVATPSRAAAELVRRQRHELEQSVRPHRREPQAALGRKARHPLGGGQAAHPHVVAPREEDPARERPSRRDRPEAHAPALAGARHTDRLAGPEALGRVGAQIDRARPGSGAASSSTSMSSHRISAPSRASHANVELLPASRSPTMAQTCSPAANAPAWRLSAPAQRPITAAAGARYGCTSSSGRTGCGTRNTTLPASRSIVIWPPLRSRSSARRSSTRSSGDVARPSSLASV